MALELSGVRFNHVGGLFSSFEIYVYHHHHHIACFCCRWNSNTNTKNSDTSVWIHRIFGFIARKNMNSSENCCHIFSEIDPAQPSTAIVNFVNRVLNNCNAIAASQQESTYTWFAVQFRQIKLVRQTVLEIIKRGDKIFFLFIVLLSYIYRTNNVLPSKLDMQRLMITCPKFITCLKFILGFRASAQVFLLPSCLKTTNICLPEAKNI